MKTKKNGTLKCLIGVVLAVIVIAVTATVIILHQDRPLGGVTLTAPADKAENLYLINGDMRAYMNLEEGNLREVEQYANGIQNHYSPLAIEFTWEGDSDGYVLYLALNAAFQDAVTYETDCCWYNVTGLCTGKQYYWKVLSKDGTKGSATYTFTTAENQPRTVEIDGVDNTRDIGGYRTIDGKRIRQEIIYRGASLKKISEEGVRAFEQDLGIRTEIDLTDSNESSDLITITKSVQPIIWYDNIFTREEYKGALKNALMLFTEESNFPIYFHCALGRDRTGTLAFILLGLCGCDQATLYKEYMLTYFSVRGNTDGGGPGGLLYNIDSLYYGFKLYKDKNMSLAENIEAYLLDLGLTKENIKSIKKNLIE